MFASPRNAYFAAEEDTRSAESFSVSLKLRRRLRVQ
jgi:hypothetical protein